MSGPADPKPKYFRPPRETPTEPARTPALDVGVPIDGQAKWAAVGLLAVCEVLALSLWFSASAVIPALRAEYQLNDLQSSLITSSVSVGFVAGTLVSAALGLADRIHPARFFTVAILVAAVANLAVLLVDPTTIAVPLLRLVVGAAMAGVYPVGMKIASSWAKGDMGLLVGLLVGALTLGSASPHLINAFTQFDWRFTMAAASGLAVLAGILVNFVRIGPSLRRAAKFEARFVLQAWTAKPLRLANLGYLGHMWELYAMWAWAGLFLTASFAVNPGGSQAALYAKIVTFVTIGLGAVGCLAGGYVADRLGRTTLTMGAMGISGMCALLVGFAFTGNPWLVVLLFSIWGITVVADSAQFSASIMELSDPWLVGTMVTVQTSLGFLLTIITIHAIPPLVEMVGWRFAFAFLAIGPFLGIWAMAALRQRPEAARLAQGRR